MAISDANKLDFLWKKVIFGVTKTASDTAKFGSNETIGSPLAVYQNKIWAEAKDIPATPPATSTSLVELKTGADRIRMTNDGTASPNMTWLAATTYGDVSTVAGDFVPPTFGTGYAVKVYLGDPNSANCARIFPDTTGEEWVFDYASGVLHFVGTIPSGKAATKGTGTFSVASNGVYVEVYRYKGKKGISLNHEDVSASKVTVVADIAARDALTGLLAGDMVHVMDASGIPSDARPGEHATYLWNGTGFTLLATQDSARSDALTQKVTLAPRGDMTLDLGYVGNGVRVVSVSVEVTEAFDGTMELSIGDGTVADRLMANGENDLQETGVYVTNPIWQSGSSETMLVATATGTATKGSAIVTFTYA